MLQVMNTTDVPLIEGGVPPPRLRPSTPPRSIWKTSAPICPRFWVDHGPTIIRVRSKTRIPSSGPAIVSLCKGSKWPVVRPCELDVQAIEGEAYYSLHI